MFVLIVFAVIRLIDQCNQYTDLVHAPGLRCHFISLLSIFPELHLLLLCRSWYVGRHVVPHYLGLTFFYSIRGLSNLHYIGQLTK